MCPCLSRTSAATMSSTTARRAPVPERIRVGQTHHCVLDRAWAAHLHLCGVYAEHQARCDVSDPRGGTAARWMYAASVRCFEPGESHRQAYLLSGLRVGGGVPMLIQDSPSPRGPESA